MAGNNGATGSDRPGILWARGRQTGLLAPARKGKWRGWPERVSYRSGTTEKTENHIKIRKPRPLPQLPSKQESSRHGEIEAGPHERAREELR